jgi:hypothetical protein
MIFFDLPAALVLLFLFQRYAREPLVACLPIHLRERIRNSANASFWSVSGFALICVSILVGTATHILWDYCTHSDYWLGQHWTFLRTNVHVPLFGWRPWSGVFQYLSSVLGIVAILIWFVRWYRDTLPVHFEPDRQLFSRDRIVVACAFLFAVVAGLVRAAIVGLPNGVHGGQRFMTDAAITGITVFCIEILAYGFLHNRWRSASKPV